MRRHGTDLISLVFGLIFLIVSGWWLAARSVDINVPHLGWFAAAALIMLGLLGVASSLRGDRNRTPAPSPTQPTTQSWTVPMPGGAGTTTWPSDRPSDRPIDRPSDRPSDPAPPVSDID